MFEHFAYLAGLVVALNCMAFIDWRHKLVFYHNPKIAAKVLAIGVLFFSLWDACGIALGIFYSGHSQFMSNIYLAPNYPLEELLFLALLCYLPLISYELFTRKRYV